MDYREKEMYCRVAVEEATRRVVREGRINDESRVVGRVFENAAHWMLAKFKYGSLEYTLTSPGKTMFIRRYLSDDEKSGWQPGYPDGLLLRDAGDGGVILDAVVECKVPGYEHWEEMERQFMGFTRLVNLVGRHGGKRGKELVSQLTGKKCSSFTVNPDHRYVYVVPRGRSAEGIPCTMDGKARLEEEFFPMSAGSIKGIVRRQMGFRNSHRHQGNWG